MSEILQNTGAKLWSLVDDHDELQSNVFDQLFGTGGNMLFFGSLLKAQEVPAGGILEIPQNALVTTILNA